MNQSKMEKRDYCLDVMKYGYWDWYPRNWIKNIENFFGNLGRAAQRAKYGYSRWDLWDMDSYLSSLISRMLDDLAENSMGFPGRDEFNTPEEWHDYLKKLSADFFEVRRLATDDFYDDEYPVADKWEKVLNEDGTTSYKVNRTEEEEKQVQEWIDRWKQKQNELNELKDSAITRLGHIWNDLWD